MTARKRAAGPSPDAVALAAAIVKALTVPEPEDGEPAEAWDRYERIRRFRGSYVRGVLSGYERDAAVDGTQDATLQMLANVAHLDARLFE